MKIVISTFTYYPNLDGVQKVTQYQAEGLAALGHDVTVLTFGDSTRLVEETHNNVKIIRFNVKSKHGFYFGDLKSFQLELLNLTSVSDIYIAIGSLFSVAKVLPKITCKKVLYLHGKPPQKSNAKHFLFGLKTGLNMLSKIIRAKIEYKKHWKYMKDFDLVTHLFNHDNTYNFFQNKGYTNNLVLENAADNEFFIDDQTIEFDYKSKNDFLLVANYNDRKNQIMALRAFYYSKSTDKSLTFIGSKKNSYYRELQKEQQLLEKKYGYRKVNLLYGIPRENMITYYRSAICVLLSSYNEYYPVVLVEAMACAVPFITTNVGIVNKLPGGIVIDTIEEMSHWIELFSSDIDIAKKYGEIGNYYARQKLTIVNQVSKFENALRNLL